MDPNYAILVDDVTVRFNRASQKVDNIKEHIIKMIRRELMFQEFLALQNITLHIKKGEAWGILGRNGSGKSTLLRVICGILAPYKGTVRVQGTMAPLIELGAGIDGELTAEENIFLNGALLGFSKAYIKDKFDEIVDFSELHNFLDMPVKNYSSGMRARLGFAVATTVQPEILIVDEVLSVGDMAFQKKCEKKIQEMLADGTTLLFVSHTMNQVAELCENAILLQEGFLIAKGSVDEISRIYEESITKTEKNSITKTDVETDAKTDNNTVAKTDVETDVKTAK